MRVRDPDIRKKLLAELSRSVDHLDAAHLDTRLSQGKHEHGQALMLRSIPIRPGQTYAPVPPPGSRGPHLGSVQYPVLALARSCGADARDVRAGLRFAEQLHPYSFPPQYRRDVPAPLFIRAEFQDKGQTG